MSSATRKQSTAVQYSVMITNLGCAHSAAAYPRYAPDWDGGWMTRQEADAKTWKTPGGAARWLKARPELQGVVYVWAR